ncbi:hypothetical protein ACWEBX_41015 [Streptomyces sp. NPDC005070]
MRKGDFVRVFRDAVLPSGWNIDHEGRQAVTDDFRRSRRSAA